MVGLMAKGLPANHQPSEQPTLMAPRLIELCFQTAGLWEMGVQGRMGLPQHIDRVSLFCPPRTRPDFVVRRGHSRPGSRKFRCRGGGYERKLLRAAHAATAR